MFIIFYSRYALLLFKKLSTHLLLYSIAGKEFQCALLLEKFVLFLIKGKILRLQQAVCRSQEKRMKETRDYNKLQIISFRIGLLCRYLGPNGKGALQTPNLNIIPSKVIREKSRGEGSLIVQDTIENVSEPKFFFNFLRKKNYIFQFHSMPKMFSPSKMFFKIFFCS